MASWSPRKLDPGFAQMYSRPIALITSTMQSAPQRSVVSDSASGCWTGGCADTGPPSAAPPASAPAVSFRNLRRFIGSRELLQREKNATTKARNHEKEIGFVFSCFRGCVSAQLFLHSVGVAGPSLILPPAPGK